MVSDNVTSTEPSSIPDKEVMQALHELVITPIEEAEQTLLSDTHYLIVGVGADEKGQRMLSSVWISTPDEIMGAEGDDYLAVAPATLIALRHLQVHLPNALNVSLRTALDLKQDVNDQGQILLPGEKP